MCAFICLCCICHIPWVIILPLSIEFYVLSCILKSLFSGMIYLTGKCIPHLTWVCECVVCPYVQKVVFVRSAVFHQLVYCFLKMFRSIKADVWFLSPPFNHFGRHDKEMWYWSHQSTAEVNLIGSYVKGIRTVHEVYTSNSSHVLTSFI